MRKELRQCLFPALKVTLPVFFGYLFFGIAFGLLMQQAGYSPIWAVCSSIFIFAGSMQFVLVDLLTSWNGLLAVVVVTFAVNIRHAFYGLSLLEKFKQLGKLKPYTIFGLTDETYSLLCSVVPPEGVRPGVYYFVITLLDQCYWVLGGFIGATMGQLIPINYTGIEFAMTALFVVIFLEQWLSNKNHIPALIGLASAALCLAVFGRGNFLPFSLILVAVSLIMARKPINKQFTDEQPIPVREEQPL